MSDHKEGCATITSLIPDRPPYRRYTACPSAQWCTRYLREYEAAVDSRSLVHRAVQIIPDDRGDSSIKGLRTDCGLPVIDSGDRGTEQSRLDYAAPGTSGTSFHYTSLSTSPQHLSRLRATNVRKPGAQKCTVSPRYCQAYSLP